jgi:hypothetical protein
MTMLSSCNVLPSSLDHNIPSRKISGSYTGCGIGAFLNDGSPNTTSMNSFEGHISREASVIMWFIDFSSVFPASDCDTVGLNGAIPMITWMPFAANSASLDNIIAGTCDTYIQTFASGAKAWGKPLFLRWGHEMNGNWYDWSGYANGSSEAAATKFKNAWIRIHNIFTTTGAGNVTWVWSPNRVSVPQTSWNDMAKILSWQPICRLGGI